MRRPEKMGADAARKTDGASRRDRRRAETRERLYEAAMRLLEDRDFDQVTVEMITEAADVGKGTFFNYFANKEAVVGYRFEKQFRLLTETLQTALPEDPGLLLDPNRCAILSGATHQVGGRIWRRMVAIAHLVLDYDAQSKRLVRSLMALTLTNEEVRAANRHVKSRVFEALEELIRMGQESGEFRTDLPARLLVEFLSEVYSSALVGWANSDAGEDLHLIVERVFTLAWGGLRPL